MSRPPRAFLDACVLYPAQLRDFLMELARASAFHPRWTEKVHEEWIDGLLENRPDLTRKQLEHTKSLMNQSVLDATVTDYEHLIEGLKLPDPDDRHVLAAAIQAGCSYIVTINLKDFPSEVLAEHGLEAVHPDAFVVKLLHAASAKVLEAAKRQRGRLKHPPMNADAYLKSLKRAGLEETVNLLEKSLGTL